MAIWLNRQPVQQIEVLSSGGDVALKITTSEGEDELAIDGEDVRRLIDQIEGTVRHADARPDEDDVPARAVYEPRT